uniref:RHD domain-containing protein n=1 Tax=Malurus cyaneus samueli TaxID=2593467 RepID=A0A8C5TE93_9PASS
HEAWGPAPDPEGGPGPGHGSDTARPASPQEEFDFSILFDYDYLKPIEEEPTPHKTNSPPSGVTYAHDVVDCGLKPCSLPFPSLSADPMGRYGQPDSIGPPPTHPANAAGASAPSPRIEITPYHELIHSGGPFRSRDTDVLVEHQANSATTSPRVTLPVPGFEGYREPLCLSPASSGSSASFISETNVSPCTSPCVSPNNGPSDDLCPQFQNIHTHYSPRTSPIMSPRTSITEETCLGRHSPSPCPNSRSSSPGAKRRYSCTELCSTQLPSTSPRQSRSPSPQPSPRIPLREDTSAVTYAQLASTPLPMDAMSSLPADPSCGVPTKIWKTSPDPSSMPSHKNSIPCHVFQTVDFHGPCEQEDRRNSAPESVLLVPPSWTKQLLPAIPICSLPVQSLPPLEWPLSSQSGSYELRIEVQPKPHHRAHYETEGSRGAVKAPTGGHPVVQVRQWGPYRKDQGEFIPEKLGPIRAAPCELVLKVSELCCGPRLGEGWFGLASESSDTWAMLPFLGCVHPLVIICHF